MNKKNLPTIVLATVISGLLSGYFITNGGSFLGGYTLYSPGIFFGITTALGFVLIFKTNILKLLAWVIGSFLSWYVALQFHISLSAFEKGPLYPSTLDVAIPWNFIAPGFLGAFMLGLCFYLLIIKVTFGRLFFIAAIGALLGIIMSWIIQSFDSMDHSVLMAVFTVWQVGIGLALAYQNNMSKQPKA